MKEVPPYTLVRTDGCLRTPGRALGGREVSVLQATCSGCTAKTRPKIIARDCCRHSLMIMSSRPLTRFFASRRRACCTPSTTDRGSKRIDCILTRQWNRKLVRKVGIGTPQLAFLPTSNQTVACVPPFRLLGRFPPSNHSKRKPQEAPQPRMYV